MPCFYGLLPGTWHIVGILSEWRNFRKPLSERSVFQYEAAAVRAVKQPSPRRVFLVPIRHYSLGLHCFSRWLKVDICISSHTVFKLPCHGCRGNFQLHKSHATRRLVLSAQAFCPLWYNMYPFSLTFRWDFPAMPDDYHQKIWETFGLNIKIISKAISWR